MKVKKKLLQKKKKGFPLKVYSSYPIQDVLKGIITGLDQDGRGVERRAHFLPQIHQKYIYVWNDSHGTPTEHWQNTSDFQKGKEISM